MSFFERTELVFGKEKLNKLKNAHIAIFGVGGVGGFAFECLVRTGVGKITIVDNDLFSDSNLNRQVLSKCDNIGKSKIEEAKLRALSINEKIEINAISKFVLDGVEDGIDFSKFDYVLDCIDTVSGKISIIKRAVEANVPIISCMGTGGKKQPLKLKIDKIENTSVCPLARAVRTALKKQGISGIKVVYSTETPIKESGDGVIPSSIFVPATAGIIMANEVVNELIEK